MAVQHPSAKLAFYLYYLRTVALGWGGGMNICRKLRGRYIFRLN